MQNGALRAPTPTKAASLILLAILMIYRENPAKDPSLGKNLRKWYSFSYSLVVQE
jgi:hypothetical protein